MAKRASWRTAAVLALALVLSGCGVLNPAPATVTPIPISPTDALPVVPIVATETPAVTSVIPATEVVSILPTAAERTTTPTPPPPITMTPTFTPSPTDTPVTPNAAAYAPVGAAPGESTGACATAPEGSFATIYAADPQIQTGLGCPLSGSTPTSSAYTTFQNGLMVWVASLGSPPQSVIYVLFNNGTYQRLTDTFTEGVDPSSTGMAPPEGFAEPVRGFGKVWRDTPGVREGIGWASSGEIAGAAQVQLFERGEMLALTQSGQTFIFIAGAPGTWTAR
ncbi:hypothetical protein [Aggregatilinea lenta]|uniref:hypothetical protein n=1 Tax=Aggregatilinea lenta TaxID=913108 RepID=UPI0013C376A0|nr:hypothetical protein [Aggregatilinea lenta]